MQHNLTVAVTGANGKIGSPLVWYLLNRGYRVVALDKELPTASQIYPEAGSRFRFEHVDATNYDAVLHGMRGCNAVIHLAGIGHPGDYVVQTHNTCAVHDYLSRSLLIPRFQKCRCLLEYDASGGRGAFLRRASMPVNR